MKLLFCTSDLPASVAIRVLTWSDWSHVAIIDGDEIIEAVWPRVKVSKLDNVQKWYKRWAVAEIKTRNDAEIIKAARSQVGKPYDIGAIFGFVARRNWEKTNKYYLLLITRVLLQLKKILISINFPKNRIQKNK